MLTGTWEIIKPGPDAPIGRCGHKVAELYGDSFLVFGGKYQEIYFNDIFLYNFVSNTWTDLTGSREISPRIGSCLMLNYPLLYIHGGSNDKGLLSDLWSFNLISSEYNLIPSKSSSPGLFNHNCLLFSDYILVFSGSVENGSPNPFIYNYSISLELWQKSSKYPDTALSNSKLQIVGSKYYLIGGNKYFQPQADIFVLFDLENSFNIEYLASLPQSVTFHDSVHIGRSIYIYGGAMMAGNSIIADKGSPVLYNLSFDELDCSQGFYSDDCLICPPGTYGEGIRSQSCLLCEPGTYSMDHGLRFKSQCFPCPYGTFTRDSGSLYCLDCEVQEECRFRTVQASKRKSFQDYVSVQPDIYDSKVNKAMLYDSITLYTVCVISLVILMSFLFLYSSRIFLFFDIFKDKHQREWNEEPVATAQGGLYSSIFLLFALYFIISPLIFFSIANISEYRTLVPSFTLDHEEYTAESCILKVKYYDYGGVCADDSGKCLVMADGSISGVEYSEILGPFCKLYENRACEVTYKFEKASFKQQGSFNLSSSEQSLYATGIEVYMQISSSIPSPHNESSIQFYIESGTNKVFNGITPNEFYINLIPSVIKTQVFYSDSPKWRSNLTGYHITYTKDSSIGSITDSEK